LASTRFIGWRPKHKTFRLTVASAQQVKSIRLPLDLRPILIILAVVSIFDVKDFAQHWIRLEHVNQADVEAVLLPLETEDLQWVQPPFGENWFLPFAPAHGMKIADQWRPWWLGDRTFPPPYLTMMRNDEPLVPAERISFSGDLAVYRSTASPRYASLNAEPGDSPCTATGEGGDISITCDTDIAGQLVVLEYYLTGWNATVNGVDVPVGPWDNWLSIGIPAGVSKIDLRYRPWDVWAGVLCSIAGLCWAAWWLTGRPIRRNSSLSSLYDDAKNRFRPEIDR